MTKLRKFRALPASERRLLLRAFAAAVAAQVGICFFSLPRLRGWIERRRARPAGYSEQQLAWAAATAARYIPGAACLTQALTAHYLLILHGYQSMLRVGVNRAGNALEAHAWVELKSGLTFGEQQGRYTTLPL